MPELALADVSHSFISAERLTKRVVLDSISLRLESGACALLLGANGAGKSTLLRITAGLLRPERGVVTFAGRSLLGWRHRGGVVGFLSQGNALYLDLTVGENFDLAVALSRSEAQANAVAIIERLGLGPVLKRRVRDCSQGMQRRAAFARVLLHDPELLLLDEPCAHIDSEGRAAMIELLLDAQRRGTSCLIVEHQLDELTALSPEAYELINGCLEPYTVLS